MILCVRMRSLALFSSVLLLVACKPTTSGDGDADADADGARDAGDTGDPDTGDGECDDNGDCDDAIACTEDLCGAGNLCRHIPLDERCPEEQVCREGRGCVEAGSCEVHEDCDDGVFCNGGERCVAEQCFAGEARDCDDGDDCTTDWCNVATDSCVHDPLPSCVPDGDVDGGVDPFDPEAHYAGVFELLPHPNSACFAATFNIVTVTFSSTPDELAVQAGSFRMTQTPRPTGESFDVTHRQTNCGDYRLMATFSNADVFTGRWTAAFFGGCNVCGDQDFAVTGVRTP